jgi:hypothetical protein
MTERIGGLTAAITTLLTASFASEIFSFVLEVV